ncbi:hypothetical protein PROFUN_05353 [Planoprotostelium fungivorum]|uniref:COMM domain-containing protein 5 n=1 Tax=Planoprotostelium fungivorum TaxID=1890364 RepID=A0A2P6NR49_9EUKA|nr:hypothetical protein PROFUN_05353 [Planoprotostelium fungivorum]
MDGILYTFLGPRVPLEVRKLIALYPNWKEEHIDAVLTLVLKYLHGGPNQPGFTQDDFEIFASTLGLDEDSVAAVFTGLYYILRSAVRSKLKEELIEKDLSQELKLTPFLVGRILTVLRKSQTRLEGQLLESNTIRGGTSLEAFKWRVDVGVSSNSQSRILQPTILMEMYTKDGEMHRFEVDVEKFQELRYQVARLHRTHCLCVWMPPRQSILIVLMLFATHTKEVTPSPRMTWYNREKTIDVIRGEQRGDLHFLSIINEREHFAS